MPPGRLRSASAPDREDAKRETIVPSTYKVVETSDVTDIELERILNECADEGWTLDTIQFAMRDSSRRPSMAFLTFVRAGAGD